jgi:hypothetical protein
MQHRYGVSHFTLKKVLASLELQGSLIKYRNTYRVPSLKTSARQHRAKIVIIGHGNRGGMIELSTIVERRFHRALMYECSRQKLDCESIAYADHQGEPVFYMENGETLSFLRPDEWVLGYILIERNIRNIPECLFRLLQTGFPVSMWREQDAEPFEIKSTRHNKNCAIFDIGFVREPGEAVAHFLLKRGHRKIAYLSPFHGNSWSVRRLEGIVSVFESAGYGRNVVPFTLTKYRSQWNFVEMVIRKYPKDFFVSRHGFTDVLDRRMRDRIDMVSSAAREVLRDNEIFIHMLPLFKQAVKEKEITAWVAGNDHTALLAHRFLRDTGVLMPDTISLVGFDDTIEAMESQITSYSFNVTSLVAAMIGHILRPNDPVYKKGTAGNIIDGTIVERASTGLTMLTR